MRNPPQTFSSVPHQHLGKIFELWDELSSFGVHQSEQGMRVCMARICEWLDAQDAFWVGVVQVLNRADGKAGQKDILSGWRVRAIAPLHAQYHDVAHNQKLVKLTHGSLHPGAANIALAAKAGQFRAYTLQSGDLVDVASFEQTDHYDFYYRQRGASDRIWVAFPVGADAESFFCFDRIGDKPHFDNDALELAAFALRGIYGFHRQLLLSHGLGLCVEPLTPAERRVIQSLLSGASEQEIATAHNLTRGTVHQYATRIYRKFGVRGRTEFTALWLSGGG